MAKDVPPMASAVPLGASPLLGEEPGPPEATVVPLMRPDSHGPLS